MPNRLHRYYGAGYLHFITTSCYHRRAFLSRPRNRDLFLQVLEQARCRYRFVVVGYVVMPEHVHLLFSEPERGDPSLVMQALKQGFARRLLRKLRLRADPAQGQLWNEALEAGHIWQRRPLRLEAVAVPSYQFSTCSTIVGIAELCLPRNMDGQGLSAIAIYRQPNCK